MQNLRTLPVAKPRCATSFVRREKMLHAAAYNILVTGNKKGQKPKTDFCDFGICSRQVEYPIVKVQDKSSKISQENVIIN